MGLKSPTSVVVEPSEKKVFDQLWVTQLILNMPDPQHPEHSKVTVTTVPCDEAGNLHDQGSQVHNYALSDLRDIEEIDAAYKAIIPALEKVLTEGVRRTRRTGRFDAEPAEDTPAEDV